MSLRLRVVYGAIIGAWGGLLAWAVLDPLLALEMESALLDAVVNGIVVGVCIGLLVGAFAGLMDGKVASLARNVTSGLGMGLLGGGLGLLVGEVLFQVLDHQTIGRLLGWAMFGLGIGMSEGLAHRSTRGMFHGSVGGLLGGALGGLAFTAVRQSLERPSAGRAWGFAILGASVGLFMSLVPVLLKTAWLKVVSSGRDEGKERIVEKALTTIGRNDSCDLGLYGDPAVMPVHAEIRQEGGQFVLLPKGPVTVNGQAVDRAVLQDEDRIDLASIKVRFKRR